jgi:hypothetical protein
LSSSVLFMFSTPLGSLHELWTNPCRLPATSSVRLLLTRRLLQRENHKAPCSNPHGFESSPKLPEHTPNQVSLVLRRVIRFGVLAVIGARLESLSSPTLLHFFDEYSSFPVGCQHSYGIQ